MVGRLTILFLACLILFLLSIFVIPRAFGETAVSAETGAFLLLSRVPDEDWSLAGTGYGSLAIKQKGSSTVKGELILDCYLLDQVLFDISRAYIKVRFPSFRASMGKARLSWGEGTYFNAGNILFDSTDLSPDLTAEVLRDEGKWLGSVNLPLGAFSFLEAAVLPPVPVLTDILSGTGSYPPITETAAGIRGLMQPGPLQVEAGYGYIGADDVHNPYISIQGNLLVDFYLSAAAGFNTTSASWENFYSTFNVSFGLFHLFIFPRGRSLSLRLEGLLRPDASWQADSSPLASEDHGLLLYPEITFAPFSSLTFLLRSVIAPVDGSALISAGLDWHITQGLHLLFFSLVNAGGAEDLFPTSEPGGGRPDLRIQIEDVKRESPLDYSPTSAVTWAFTAEARPVGLYPPSITDRSRPSQCFSARSRVFRVSWAKPLSVIRNVPRKSASLLSNPAEMRTKSGEKERFSRVGISCSSQARCISKSPDPSGSGQFNVYPFPFPSPV